MKTFPASQLLINSDGSVFHLHLRSEQLAQKIILVGDQGRVPLVASFFDEIECEVQSREFHTITGVYRGKRISCVSTGIGTDNCDIVLNELDALTNIDFTTRTLRPEVRSLDIVRIGTCGALQEDIPLGTFLASTRSIGFDGLLAFYEKRDEISDTSFEKAFVEEVGYPAKAAVPYVVKNSETLLERVAFDMMQGCTISANGFYGPQGRVLRCNIANAQMNECISAFRYRGERINNFEMEGSAIAALSLLMGHNALTVCCAIAQRKIEKANTDYKPRVKELISNVRKNLTMKIYTKTGDNGTTQLSNGNRVKKNDALLEAYGTADELNSLVGLLKSRIIKITGEGGMEEKSLLHIQNRLFKVGGQLSQANVSVVQEDIELLEKWIDTMQAQLPALHAFILPAGSETVALTHVCRTVCRRLERRIVAVSDSENDYALAQKYVNRLSDYFFTLARYISTIEKTPEVVYEP